MFDNLKLAINKTFKEWMDSFNSLLDTLASLPLPIAYGKNTQAKYLKFANGTVWMWGHIDHGKNFPCTDAWGGGQFASKDFTITYPIPLVEEEVVVIPFVAASVNADTWVLKRSQSFTNFVACYLCAVSETVNVKTLDFLIIGQWK